MWVRRLWDQAHLNNPGVEGAQDRKGWTGKERMQKKKKKKTWLAEKWDNPTRAGNPGGKYTQRSTQITPTDMQLLQEELLGPQISLEI